MSVMTSVLRKRKTFLRWSLINALSLVLLGVLYLHDFFENLTGAPLLGALAITGFSVLMTAYAGWLSWKTDDYLEDEPVDRSQLLHDLNHVFHAIWVCQILGIIGALVGYREQTKAAAESVSGDAGAAVQEVFTALGNGLIATMLGVLFSLLFFIEYRLIEHSLGRD